MIASATGTGKTIVAAFDYARSAKTLNRNPKLLFLAHRKDIVEQAREKYRAVLQQSTFGALISDGEKFSSQNAGQIFCTVQSWATHISKYLPYDYFDLIVLDECHHAAALTELCAEKRLFRNGDFCKREAPVYPLRCRRGRTGHRRPDDHAGIPGFLSGNMLYAQCSARSGPDRPQTEMGRSFPEFPV